MTDMKLSLAYTDMFLLRRGLVADCGKGLPVLNREFLGKMGVFYGAREIVCIN